MARSTNGGLSSLDGNETDFRAFRSGSGIIPEYVWEQAKSSVVMIETRDGYGSGFLATFPWKLNCSTYLVTCCHVLKSMEIARNAKIYFHRVKDDGVCIPARDLLQFDNNLHQMNKDLDYFVIGVNEGFLGRTNALKSIKPLSLCSPQTQFQDGHTAYIVHHPSKGVTGTLKRCRSFNACNIINFTDPLIAHHLHTEKGSSGSPLLVVQEDSVYVCGLHLGYQRDQGAPLFNKALYIHVMYEHLKTGSLPTSTIELAASQIAEKFSNLHISEVVPVSLCLDDIDLSWEKNAILLACEGQASGCVTSVTVHCNDRTALVRFTTERATRNVAMRKTLEVNGRLVRVSLQEDPMEDKIHKCPLGRTIVISNIPRTISDQHLQLYLKETCRQNEPVLQRKGSQCLATFNQDCAGEVAGQLNERQCPLEDSKNQKHYIQAHRLTPPDGIHVRNIENEQFRNFSYIEKYFTNEGRSGGKGVKSVTVGPNKSRIVLFGDPATVSNVMDRSHCAMLGENVELYRFSSALVDWTTGSPCQVEVVQGKIERCDTAAYVNSPPSSLCLDNGPLAKSLRDAGGPDFVTACKDYVAKHGNVKEGDIAVTVGGRMKCQCVIHAVGKAFNGQESERIMSQLVKKVLDECERRRLVSVAIPAIGTGVNKFPINISSRVITLAVSAHINTFACQSLKRVVLVASEGDMYTEFRKNLEQLM